MKPHEQEHEVCHPYCAILNTTIAPPRSRLFQLEPIGLGTAMIECFTSYLHRLADAHAVNVKNLVLHEILPQFNNIYVSNPHLIKSFWMSSSALNGTSLSASNWLHAVESLTLYTSLQALTMRVWHQVFTTRMLMRRTQAWCTRCLAEWREQQRDIYIPLLWMLQPVTVCIHHRCYLSTQCPYPDCHSLLSALMPYGHLGYCSSCKRWLPALDGTGGEARPVPHDELCWQTWVGTALGTLLAPPSSITETVTLTHMTSILSTILQKQADGNLKKLASWFSLSDVGLRDIIRGHRTPQLDTLLRICYGLGTTPLELLTTSETSLTFDTLTFPPPRLSGLVRRTYQVLDFGGVQRQLEAIVAGVGEPPLSMAEVARRIGHDQSNLTERFPQLCHDISTRYRVYHKAKRQAWIQEICEEIQQIMRSLHNAGVYPSHTRIKGRLTEPTCLRLAEARTTRHTMLQELGYVE